MPTSRIRPFDDHAAAYDEWFEEHAPAYESELQAIRGLLPEHCRALEIGVGTGRFAKPLGIPIGLEPSRAMGEFARRRGIHVIRGVAEHLPFRTAAHDLALMVTTLCFLEDVDQAFREAHRILEPGGYLIVGFLDRATPLGKTYEDHVAGSPFYRRARFISSAEVGGRFARGGFDEVTCVQTIFASPGAISRPSPVVAGHGSGLFVVMRARRSL